MTVVYPIYLSDPSLNAGILQVLSQLQAAPAGHQEAGPVVSAASARGPPQTLLL